MGEKTWEQALWDGDVVVTDKVVQDGACVMQIRRSALPDLPIALRAGDGVYDFYGITIPRRLSDWAIFRPYPLSVWAERHARPGR